MSKLPKRPRDPAQLAKLIVDIAELQRVRTPFKRGLDVMAGHMITLLPFHSLMYQVPSMKFVMTSCDICTPGHAPAVGAW